MRVLSLTFLAISSLGLAASIDVSSVPTCGRTCLISATSASTSCSSTDAHCLCNDESFVNALACCLSTQCAAADQTIAVQYDQQWCGAANASAPSFAGCAPINIVTTIISGNTVTSFAVAGKSTTSTSNTQYTITALETIPASFTNTKFSTVTFVGQPLYTGSCTVPFFAVAMSGNEMTMFPEVGCAPDRPSCCAVDINVNAGITKCPQDYFTTANGCCPLGYQVYYTNIGLETPCYSTPVTALVPATTLSMNGVTVITDHVFSKKYTLIPGPGYKFPTPGIVGIVINAVLFIAIVVAIIWRRRVKAERVRLAASTFPPEEPTLPQADMEVPHELVSPEMTTVKPPPAQQYQQPWPIQGFSPPAYEGDKSRPHTAKVFGPQELPGSTFIHEHHHHHQSVVSASSDAGTDVTPKTPPTKSPVLSVSTSPAVSPAPQSSDARTNGQGGYVSPPFGSPGFIKS